MANIDDIARLANVSTATVSRVFNNSPYVSEKVKMRVIKSAKELNYEPSMLARSLAMKKTNTIGLIVPDISNAYYSEVVRGIEDICNIYKYNVILCNTDNSNDKEIKYINMLKSRWADGIIFQSSYFSNEVYKIFSDSKIPYVLAGRGTKYDVPYVIIDNKKAAYDATKYLISIGHKKIGIVHGIISENTETVDSFDRLMGYKTAMSEAGLKVYDELVEEADFKAKSGYNAVLKMLKSGVMPDAIFAISDVMAMGAINAIFDFGLKCPEDISVIGFDNIDLAEVTRPPLTTIEQPRYDIGAVSARILIKIINNEKLDNKNVILNHKLIVRDSCKKLK